MIIWCINKKIIRLKRFGLIIFFNIIKEDIFNWIILIYGEIFDSNNRMK